MNGTITHKPLILGSGVIGLTLPAHFFLPQDISVALAAILLSLIAGAYIGFAAADGRAKVIIVEGLGATLFGLAALLGLLHSPLWIPAGIFAHAGWDMLHHNSKFGARIPDWYIPFCVLIDIVVGAALFALYLA